MQEHSPSSSLGAPPNHPFLINDHNLLTHHTSYTIHNMVDRTKCKEGGEHDFNDFQEDIEYGYEIITSRGCDKCSEVYENDILRWDGTYDYENCTEDECTGSERGHDWYTSDSGWESSEKYYVEECETCDGTRTYVYRHTRTEYTDGNGHTI